MSNSRGYTYVPHILEMVDIVVCKEYRRRLDGWTLKDRDEFVRNLKIRYNELIRDAHLIHSSDLYMGTFVAEYKWYQEFIGGPDPFPYLLSQARPLEDHPRDNIGNNRNNSTDNGNENTASGPTTHQPPRYRYRRSHDARPIAPVGQRSEVVRRPPRRYPADQRDEVPRNPTQITHKEHETIRNLLIEGWTLVRQRPFPNSHSALILTIAGNTYGVLAPPRNISSSQRLYISRNGSRVGLRTPINSGMVLRSQNINYDIFGPSTAGQGSSRNTSMATQSNQNVNHVRSRTSAMRQGLSGNTGLATQPRHNTNHVRSRTSATELELPNEVGMVTKPRRNSLSHPARPTLPINVDMPTKPRRNSLSHPARPTSPGLPSKVEMANKPPPNSLSYPARHTLPRNVGMTIKPRRESLSHPARPTESGSPSNMRMATQSRPSSLSHPNRLILRYGTQSSFSESSIPYSNPVMAPSPAVRDKGKGKQLPQQTLSSIYNQVVQGENWMKPIEISSDDEKEVTTPETTCRLSKRTRNDIDEAAKEAGVVIKKERLR